MVKIEKKNLTKKQISIIIVASLLVFLIVGYAILSALISAGVFGSDNLGKKDPPEILEGESIYNNMAVVYPYIAKSKIISVGVSSHKDSFALVRPSDEKNGYASHFVMSYLDENGEPVPYYPSIMGEGEDVSYVEFYSTSDSGGLNIYKIDYIMAAIGALYFDTRIQPEADRGAQLARYGLTQNEREVVYFTYLDEEGKEREQTIYIGDSLITGVGYYFMIEGRDYIYSSASSQTFEYILGDFESFLHSRITAPGRPTDGLYEPYLTTGYKQWTNKYFGINNGGAGMYPTENSEVIIQGEITTNVYESEKDGDGYRRGGVGIIPIDLQSFSKIPELDRLVSLIKSTAVGDYSGNEKSATVITNMNLAKLGSKYSYSIYAIESVIAEDGEHFEVGYPVGENTLVKVTYNYKIDGKSPSAEPCHAVIDLTAENIPQEVKDRLRSASVGDNLTGVNNIDFEITYNEENATKRTKTLVITDIFLITKLNGDGTVAYPETIDENSVVTYGYKLLVDGFESSSGRDMIDLSAVTEGEDLEIKKLLLGMKIENRIDKKVFEENVYCQPMMDFHTYTIKSVKGFVDKEMVVSFVYFQFDEDNPVRDPFYAESIYNNKLENANRHYALDSIACQNVTYLLGGIGETSNSQISAGLKGSETVAVGLSAENMDKFGLYDGYTVYFELPRDIARISGTDDFTYLDTLGCYLYISKTNSDGTRYIGSSLYDIIVKIDGKQFDYLEKSFDEYWVRKDLVMVDYKNLDKITLTLGMTDVYGSYEFDLEHDIVYGDEHLPERPDDTTPEYNVLTVTVRPLSEKISDSAFKTILENEERESLKVRNIYERVTGEYIAEGHDTQGDANFKRILTLMYGIKYEGVLENKDYSDAPKIMSISFYLESTPYGYTYDFYRVSDSRVAVHIFRIDSNGDPIDNSSDDLSGFYIPAYGAKKIVNAFSSLLNGKNVDPDGSIWG